MLKLKADPIPSTHIKKEIISADRFLDKIPSSERYATPGSSKEIEELKDEGINVINVPWVPDDH